MGKIFEIKKYVRQHEKLMMVLSRIYSFTLLNIITGYRGLKFDFNGAFLKKTRIKNNGKDNYLYIGKGTRINNSTIQIFGNNNIIKIENDCVLNNVNIWISDGSCLEIGNNTHFTGDIHIAVLERTKCSIGKRCLFSNQITIRTGDSHSIVNEFGERINHSKNIKIGNHVKIKKKVIILKGVIVGDDSGIGTNSVVTNSEVNKNQILAGIPAKTIKEKINWNSELI